MVDGDEWPAVLDVGALLASGWRPTPFRQFIVKIHSRCNLACDYCYMYEMADQGWRRQPRRMSRATIDRLSARIADHVRDHSLSRIEIFLHGGEPLLAGVEHLRYAVTAFREAIGPAADTVLRLQTNGVLLDASFLRLFDELDVLVGVSLDGDQEGHNLHRRRAGGLGSHTDVRAGLERLITPPYDRLFSGLIATIDLRNDPVTTYEALLEFGPPQVDFHLPHGNWETPPPGWTPAATPYADWLIAVFDRWYRAPLRETTVRLFTEIIRLLLGRPSRSESIGLSPVAMVVVETDGSLEQVDSLKSAYDGAARTTLNVFDDPLDRALTLPSIAARQIGDRALPSECLSCEVGRICGGGLYPHRYRKGGGFRNPSIYSADLHALITHIRTTVAADVTALRRGRR